MPHFEIEAKFVVAGYAVMPEHIPSDRRAKNCRSLRGDASPETACLAAVPGKERPDKQDLLTFGGHLPPSFWLPRSHDFNVGTKKKYVEKLNYIHFNPVKRGLVTSPELWAWSSVRHYWYGEEGPVKIGE